MNFTGPGRAISPRLYTAMGIDTAFFTGTGKRSLESYLPHFYRGQSLILVHNVARPAKKICNSPWRTDR